ncbi:MAG: 50S ribosomal protein L7ae [Erysipelotrichaceae bacterium]
MDKRVMQLLGLAKSARKVVCGSTLLNSMGNVNYLFIASDASEKTKERFEKKCFYYQIKYCAQFDSQTLSEAIGQSNRMCVGIADRGFAKKFILLIEGGQDGKSN